MNEDFEQLRRLYTRLTEHQFLLVCALAHADALADAGVRGAGVETALATYRDQRASLQAVLARDRGEASGEGRDAEGDDIETLREVLTRHAERLYGGDYERAVCALNHIASRRTGHEGW